MVPILEKAHTGDLTISDLWAQNNEHRILFPKLIMLSLASLSKWNIKLELYANLIIAGLTLLFLHFILQQSVGGYIASAKRWLLVLLSFLIFSPIQYEIWTWGWGIIIFLVILATVVAVWSVNRWPGQLKGILISIVSAVIASYSFNNGLLIWIAVGMLLIVQGERKWGHITLWITAFAATVTLYYYDYTIPPHHPSILIFIYHPYDFVRYVLAYIGSPLGAENTDFSVIIGLILTLLLCFSTIGIYRTDKNKIKSLLPWLCLSLFAILSAAATGVGRLGFGVSQALSSRYTTISTLFTISTLVITVLWIGTYLKNIRKFPIKLVIAISLTVAIIIPYTLTFSKGITAFKDRKDRIGTASLWLEYIDDVTDNTLKILHPDPALVREKIKTLSKINMLCWVGWQSIQRIKGGLMYIDTVNGKPYEQAEEKVMIDFNKDKLLTIKGWAVDDRKRNAGDVIYLIFKDKEEKMMFLPIRERRPDVAKYFGEDGYIESGWLLTKDSNKFKEGCYTLSVRILRKYSTEYYELEGKKPICFNSERGKRN